MTSPEGWQRARRDLGESLTSLDRQNREYDYAATRLSETAHLIRESAHLEARLELARSRLDLAAVRDRRARSNHDHTNELALRQGASPESRVPYTPDSSLGVAQAEYDKVQLEYDRVAQEIQGIERALRARLGLPPT